MALINSQIVWVRTGKVLELRMKTFGRQFKMLNKRLELSHEFQARVSPHLSSMSVEEPRQIPSTTGFNQ